MSFENQDTPGALDGYRVETIKQYKYVRDFLLKGPDMKFMVWQGKSFVEHAAHLPNHQFGVYLKNYRGSLR